MKLLGLGGGEVVEVLVRAILGVEPVDPLQRLDFDVVDVAPRSLPADECVLEGPVRRLGRRVVEGIADRPDGGLDALVDEPRVMAMLTYCDPAPLG